MSRDETPSVDRLAGQLRYLLDERPELRTASPERIREQLSLEDRTARALAQHPMATGEEIRRRAADLDDRITLDAVRQALRTLTGEAVRPASGPAAPDDTPRRLFLAALAIWTAGLVGWIVNLAVNGPSRSTWTGGALLVVMGAAIGGAISSHREGRAA